MTKNKSILRGEGYYSSNNSNNLPDEILKATQVEKKVEPVKSVVIEQQNIATNKPEPKQIETQTIESKPSTVNHLGSAAPVLKRQEVDVEDSVDNEFNFLINKKTIKPDTVTKQTVPTKTAPEIKQEVMSEGKPIVKSEANPDSRPSSKPEQKQDPAKTAPAKTEPLKKESAKKPSTASKPDIDFFDEKVEAAHNEINKLASSDQEYYDEEEEVDSDIDIQSVEANKLKITVGPQSRIDETIEGMDSEKKLKFAGIICEYID